MFISLSSQSSYYKLKIDYLVVAIASVVWIIDSRTTIYVFENRNLFKNVRHNYAKVETINNTILLIKEMSNYLIYLFKDSNLILI